MKKNKSSLVLEDVQSSSDLRNIRIDQVGVKGLLHPITLKDKRRETQSTVAEFTLAVDLPHNFKGTHMSRFVEILNAHGNELSASEMPRVLYELRSRLHADCAHIKMTFPYFIEKSAPVTGAKGLMDYKVTFDVTDRKGEVDFVMHITVPVTTLCPCSKTISERGAHNQRGEVHVALRTTGEMLWIEEVIELVESSASCELFSLLKRLDEKFVTERAYDNPVFVEDLVRNVAVKLNNLKNVTWYRIEVENHESIHNHSAFAVIEKG
jgi:GTP cyclohydrolase I